MIIRTVVALSLLFLLGCSNDEERLKINRDIANLQEQIYELERSQTELKGQLDRTKEEVDRKLEDRTSQADIQDQVNSINETLSQFEARVQDLDSKISKVSRTRTEVATAPMETGEGEAPVPIESVSGEVVEQQFNKAYLDFNRGKYNVAILGFQGVLDNFPNSPYSDASYYYLGRSYLENKDYQKAGENFRVITTQYTKGDFIKQAMYYEGQCYYFLNQYSKAILTLRDLIKQFPGTQEAMLAQQFLKKAGYEK